MQRNLQLWFACLRKDKLLPFEQVPDISEV